MASAMDGEAPKRKGPFSVARHSRQMLTMRSMSAKAPAQTLKPGWCAFRFIGNAERKLEKPECISPDIERHRARALSFFGNSPASGKISLRYSAIASVSQILRPLWVRHGTRKDGESSRSSARVEGSSLATICSSKSRPANLQSSQPRSDQDP